MPIVSLIAAVARNRAIGKDNQLLWHLPEDMKHFRETTRGKPVIMGRKTWESLPESFRPLPGRKNIVVSRNPAYEAPGANVAASLEAALALVGDAPEVFVIGGEQIYRAALEFCDRLYLTEVDISPEADAFFPEVNPAIWQEVERRQSEASTPPCSFVTYARQC